MDCSEAESAVMLHYIPELRGESCIQPLPVPDVVPTATCNNTLGRVAEARTLSRPRRQPMFEDAVLAFFRSMPNGRILDVNSAFAQMFGYSDPAEITAGARDISWDMMLPEQRAEILKLASDERNRRGLEVTYRRKDNSAFIGNLHIWTVKDEHDRVLWLEGCIEDISERKAIEEQLQYLSTHDALTGLYNRWFFEQEIERLGRRQIPISILIADIDELKMVNDRAGHVAGDQQLQRAARVLLQGSRAEDVVARVGGDEFAVLLPHTDAAAVEAIVRHLRQDLMTENVNGSGPMLSLAFGVATLEPGEELIDAFQRADRQMYQDKARRSESRQY